jgi:hypothetical protein
MLGFRDELGKTDRAPARHHCRRRRQRDGVVRFQRLRLFCNEYRAPLLPGARRGLVADCGVGVFAAGFLMRPLGSLVFGHIGDKMGRKMALTGIVNLAARGMLVASVARRLGSGGPLLAHCAAPL